MSDVLSHKCPACGATLEFDIGTQMVKCPYCDNVFNPEDLKKNEGDLTIELASDGGEEWDMKELYGLSEYQCQSCGGDIYSDSTTSATLCPYCGSAVILKGRLSGILKPDKVIPFQKTKDDAMHALESHLGGKRFVPKSFLNDNKLEEVKGLYVPFWVYDADLEAHVKYDCVKVRTWTSGKTEYTERKYYMVTRKGDVAFDHVPADGSTKMPDDLMESIEPFDHTKAEAFTTSYLSGYVADKYDLDQDAVRPRVRKRLQEGAADAFRSTVHGYDEVSVNDSMITAKSSSVDYVLYPVWMLTTDWDGKKFTFAMNGQTGKLVGNLPVDKMKLSIATIALFALLTGIIGIASCVIMGEVFFEGIAFGVFLAAIAAYAFYAGFKGKLKSVAFQHGARAYYREGSMNLSYSNDEFLYKHVTTRKISD
jgi:DNA-directed RNA polymerase subunit RPC12/RpoP